MKLTQRERQILIGAAVDLAAWRTAEPVPTWPKMTGAERQHNDAIGNARDRIVDCAPAKWLGREKLLPSDRVANSRAYASLQAKGLAARMSARGEHGQRFKTFALEILPAGEALAAELHAQQNTPSPAIEPAPVAASSIPKRDAFQLFQKWED